MTIDSGSYNGTKSPLLYIIGQRLWSKFIHNFNLCAVLSGSKCGFAIIVPSCSFFSGLGGNFFFLFFGLFTGEFKTFLEEDLFLLLVFFGLFSLKLVLFFSLIFIIFFSSLCSSSSSSFSSFWIPLSLSCLSSSSSLMSSRISILSLIIWNCKKRWSRVHIVESNLYFFAFHKMKQYSVGTGINNNLVVSPSS